MIAHSIPLVSLGAFILVFGFLAFNGGSQASITAAGDGIAVSKAVVNTLVACCVAGTTVLFLNKILPGGKWSLLKIINGCLIGMVSVCAGCDGYYPWASAIVSCMSGNTHFSLVKTFNTRFSLVRICLCFSISPSSPTQGRRSCGCCRHSCWRRPPRHIVCPNIHGGRLDQHWQQ